MIHETLPAAAICAPGIETLIPPPHAEGFREHAARWAGIALSAAILAILATQIGKAEVGRIVALAPREPLFWALFAASYLLAPAAEWAIYRRIWRLPAAGIVPLLRKQVANEIVLGYSGDAHFYLWARRHAGITGSPFGAIKDVAMLSAVAGNLATLAMMLVMAPALVAFLTGAVVRTFAVSVAIVVVTSLAIFLFRGALFSLSRRDLRIIFATHFARIALSILLTAALWHLLLPAISFGGLLALVTLRMMLWRLPLLPNKDILFAGLTFMLLGRHADASAAMALMASLMLATHLIVGASSGIASIAEWQAGRRPMPA